MTQDELELLSKEELILLILAQAKMLEQLKADYEELKRRFDEQQNRRRHRGIHPSLPPKIKRAIKAKAARAINMDLRSGMTNMNGHW